jgi:hypothetical protein
MLPNEKPVKLMFGPFKIDGAAVRVVELPDGSGRIETWVPGTKSWEPGGAGWDETFNAIPASPAFLAAKGVPSEE